LGDGAKDAPVIMGDCWGIILPAVNIKGLPMPPMPTGGTGAKKKRHDLIKITYCPQI
jgi:hypothetical protein